MKENSENTPTAQDFNKVVRLGTTKTHNSRGMNVFCKIEYKSGRLSISGVEGPLPSGNALGACGQIDMHLRSEQNSITLAPNWTRGMLARFFDVWDKWHLNDMRAACVHQRELGWLEMAKEEVTIYHFRLTKGIQEARRENEKEAIKALKSGSAIQWSDEAVKQANLPLEIKNDEPELPEALREFYEPNKPQYTSDSHNKPSEVKTRGWLSEKDHKLGILSKPCPVCGYKYGSAWLREEVPQDVLDFLKALPNTDKTPAWV
jgi:hypothetical protein